LNNAIDYASDVYSVNSFIYLILTLSYARYSYDVLAAYVVD